MPLPVIAAAGVAVGTYAYHAAKRANRKQGDKKLAKERTQERDAELQQGGPSFPTPIQHCLHPHHDMILSDSAPDTKSCYACKKLIRAREHYHCSKNCEFDLHTDCALSQSIQANLVDEKQLETFAHKHPLNIVTGQSKFICKHCKDEGKTKYRYYCKQCDEYFHCVCAVHPTRLRSFLHPDHELDLKVRPYFKNCVVCLQSGKLNTRVYCCKACEFYVHPECAQSSQQYRCAILHKDHVLVYREVDSYESCVCKACGEKCKYWCYSCSFCEDNYNFHKKCLSRSFASEKKESSRSIGRDLGIAILVGLEGALIESVEDGSLGEFVGDVLDEIFE